MFVYLPLPGNDIALLAISL